MDEPEPTLILNQNGVKSVKSGRNYELALAGFPVGNANAVGFINKIKENAPSGYNLREVFVDSTDKKPIVVSISSTDFKLIDVNSWSFVDIENQYLHGSISWIK